MAGSTPLVSAIMAAYNYERYVGEALESALDQDYPADRLELIVIDDGSTDGTAQIARRYADESGGRIRYIRQDNAGLAAATTRGLQEARGELITLLDADDVWVTSRTRLLVDALARNPKAGLVYGDTEVVDEHGCTLAKSWLQDAAQVPFRGQVAAHLLRSNFVMAPSLMARAALLPRFCPIPARFPAQDWYIAARVAEVAEIDFVPAVVARYRRHGANMSHGKDSPCDIAALLHRDVGMRRWMLANLRAPHLTVEELNDAYSYFSQTLLYVARVKGISPEALIDISDEDRATAGLEIGAGRSALAVGDFSGAAGHFVAGLAADPFDPAARDGLDHAVRRLAIPLPRSIEANGAEPRPRGYGIADGYTTRPHPDYFVDLPKDGVGIPGAPDGCPPDAYAQAAAVAERLRAVRIIDLGCGAGGRLRSLYPRFAVLGLDYGPNLELARRSFPDGVWREHDFDHAGPLPLEADEVRASVVVCANVIEQLGRPEFLLENLREILPQVEAIVISTADRNCSGAEAAGPPSQPWRVREWKTEEFAALLEAFGFEHGDLGITRADSGGQSESTLCATLYPDAARAGAVAAGRCVAAR
jgi:SAM-dependent methyltransferase